MSAKFSLSDLNSLSLGSPHSAYASLSAPQIDGARLNLWVDGSARTDKPATWAVLIVEHSVGFEAIHIVGYFNGEVVCSAEDLRFFIPCDQTNNAAELHAMCSAPTYVLVNVPFGNYFDVGLCYDSEHSAHCSIGDWNPATNLELTNSIGVYSLFHVCMPPSHIHAPCLLT